MHVVDNQLTDHVVREVRIPADEALLNGDLAIPAAAKALVLFAHGSGSSRHSPRNAWVASELQRAGIATLLFDLLTADEETRDVRTREHRFDIGLLARRLARAARWADAQAELRSLACGFFGASTGSAAALAAAAALGDRVGAIVSRGGRPDLAGSSTLAQIRAPTLLIVGGNDDGVIKLNRRALADLRCEKRLEIVPRASHLFEEPGTLTQVATLACDWFVEYLIVESAR